MVFLSKDTFAALSIILFSMIYAAVSYDSLPERIAVHWNAQGLPDEYSGREFVFLLPLVSVGIFIIFELLPRLDPMKDNYRSFAKEYSLLKIAVLMFLLYLGVLTVVFQSFEFNFTQALLPALAVLFYILGTFLSKAKRNWFIGIRTPWTLASDEVWEKTHSRGSVIFKMLGPILLVLMFFPAVAMPVFAICIFGGVGYLFVYSYLEWCKLRLNRDS